MQMIENMSPTLQEEMESAVNAAETLKECILFSMDLYFRHETGQRRAELRKRIQTSMRIYNARVHFNFFKANWWLEAEKK